MDPILHLNEFFVEGGSQKQSHALLHITEPSTPEERERGYFFAICETNGADNEYIIKLQGMIDEIENGYYEARDGENNQNFEKILEKINQQSYPLIQNNSTLHCVVGVIRPPEIIFAFHNAPQIILFYKKKDGSYQKMDLVDANREEKGNSHIFSQIVQGKISPEDYMFIGTPHIADYFSHDRLQKIISSRPPRQSAEHLEKVLSELRNGLSFGGLIIHLGAPEGHTPVARRTENDGQAVNRLFVTEQNTASTLSPSLTNSFGDKIKGWQNNLSNKPTPQPSYPRAEVNSIHLKNRPNRQADAWEAKDILSAIWTAVKYLGQAILWVLLVLLSLLKAIGKFFITIFFLITNMHNRRKEIINNLSMGWHNHKQNLQQLPLITKILVGASLIVVICIAGGILFLSVQKQRQAASKLFQDNLQQLTTQKDAAESALIYNDTVTALDNINSAKDLLAKMSCESRENKAICQGMDEQIQSILMRVRKVISVDPQLVTDWSQLPGITKLNQITKIGTKIIGTGDSQNIVVYDLLSRENTTLDTGYSSAHFIAGTTPKENDYSLFLLDKNQLLQYNFQDNSFKKLEIEYPNQTVDIKSIIVYNRRLYSLDVLNNQIYKHDNIKNGFGPGKEWLKASADLKDSADFTIEGDLFILKSTGEIVKFSAGVSQPFTVQGLDPAITGGTKIWSYNDLQYLYVLDAAEKRLVILEKDGRLKSQVTAKIFTNPTGMIVDEPNKNAYILDSNKLYQIPLP